MSLPSNFFGAETKALIRPCLRSNAGHRPCAAARENRHPALAACRPKKAAALPFAGRDCDEAQRPRLQLALG
ncbi:hypothetical protein ACVJBD_000340 [Rhizobium mongolense]